MVSRRMPAQVDQDRDAAARRRPRASRTKPRRIRSPTRVLGSCPRPPTAPPDVHAHHLPSRAPLPACPLSSRVAITWRNGAGGRAPAVGSPTPHVSLAPQYRAYHSVEKAHGDSAWGCTWVADGRVVTGSVDERVKVWREEEKEYTPEFEFEGHNMGVVALAADPTQTVVAVSSMDCVVRLWNVESGIKVRQIDCEPVETWGVKYNPLADSKQLATGSQSGRVNLWDVSTGTKSAALETHGAFTMSLAYSPDGKRVACGSQDGMVYVFDVATSALLNKLEAHTMPVRAITFTENGAALVTGSDDGRMNVYDTSSGAEASSSLVASLTGHTDWVLSVAAHPADDTALATGSSDKKVKLWDLRRRECIQTLENHTEPVWCVAYNGDGSKLASVGDDALLQVYVAQ